MKGIYTNTTADIISLKYFLKVFPLRSETRERCPLEQLLFIIILKVLARAMKQEKERLEKIDINSNYLKFVQYIVWRSYLNKAVLKNLSVLILA